MSRRAEKRDGGIPRERSASATYAADERTKKRERRLASVAAQALLLGRGCPSAASGIPALLFEYQKT